MKNCRAIDMKKNCKISLVEDNNIKSHYISRCNTGKIMAFSARKNDMTLLKTFLEKVKNRAISTNRKPEEILKKLSKQFKILAICYKNISKMADKLNVSLSITDDLCICIVGIDKNNLYLQAGNKEHSFLNCNKNCAFVRNKTIENMIKKL
jgi:tryptophanyl-tRNA synthetase